MAIIFTIFTDFRYLEHIYLGFVLTKYQCPSLLARYLLLLGINIFGFAAKGIARLQIDDSTCLRKPKPASYLIFGINLYSSWIEIFMKKIHGISSILRTRCYIRKKAIICRGRFLWRRNCKKGHCCKKMAQFYTIVKIRELHRLDPLLKEVRCFLELF